MGLAMPVTVRVGSDDAERARWMRAVLGPGVPASRIGMVAGSVWTISGLFQLAIPPHTLIRLVTAGMYVALGIFYLIVVRGQWSFARIDGDATVTVDDRGLAIADGYGNRVVAWSRVDRVVDAGDAYLVVLRTFPMRAVALPKQSLGDGASFLWSFFERRLIGPSMLVRPRRTDTIFNSARA